MAAKQKGTVKWFNSTKGYGFITPEIPEGSEDTPEDLFVHQSSINAEGFRSLAEGEAVEFNVETGEDGRTKAVDVTGPDGAYVQGAPRRQPRRNVAADGSVPQGNSRSRGRGRNNRGPAGERKPPPGTPGESSGLQVVVHNLPWSCTAEALSEAFSSCGEIECADIIQDNSGRSRGFGTVRFKSTDSVQTAIDTMSNTEIEARPITVKMDRFA